MAQTKRRRPPHNTQGQGQQEEQVTTTTSLAENIPQAPAVPGSYRRISERLRTARDARGETIKDIAARLCIKAAFLAALENGQYDELPANAYTVGFLRTYANYLGLDGEAILDDYRMEMQGRNRAPQLVPPQPIAEGKTPSMPILIGSAVFALLIYGTWHFFSSDDRSTIAPPTLPEIAETGEAGEQESALDGLAAIAAATDMEGANEEGTTASETGEETEQVQGITIGEPSDAVKKTETAQAQTAQAQEQTAAQKPAAPTGEMYGDPKAKVRLVIRAERDAWLVVQNGEGDKLFSRMLKSGDSYRVPNEPGLRLTTGNAGGIVLSFDGNELPRLGKPNQIARNISLDSVVGEAGNR
ncbi:MAG: DUF4115 domain-containing protein [Alphaproteobacteria bacterium]|nr:DUF4115 domain-containing protein [Alphaproteobacteria bacterium]